MLMHKAVQHALVSDSVQRMRISDKQKQGTVASDMLATEWSWMGSHLQVPCSYWQSCHTLSQMLPSERHPRPQHSHRPSAECGKRPHLPAPSQGGPFMMRLAHWQL